MARLFFKPERQWDFSYYLWMLIIASFITFGFRGESFCQESYWTIMIYIAGDDIGLRGIGEGMTYGTKIISRKR